MNKTLQNLARLATVTILGGAGLAAPALQPATAASRSTATLCSVTPAADEGPMGPTMVGTVRATGGEIEVLHRVDCYGQPVMWKWLSATDVLAL